MQHSDIVSACIVLSVSKLLLSDPGGEGKVMDTDTQDSEEILDPPPRFGPVVISGTSYLVDQELIYFGRFGLLIGMAFGFVPYCILTMFASRRSRVPLDIAVIAYAWMFTDLLRRMRGEAGNVYTYAVGREAEEAVIEDFRRHLDHQWTILRNLQLPGETTDVDLVLVGPGGIYAIEVKRFGQETRCANGQWQRLTPTGWVTRRNPTKQARTSAKRLQKILRDAGLEIDVEPVVATAQPLPLANIHRPSCAVWVPANIAAELETIRSQQRITKDACIEVCTCLKAIERYRPDPSLREEAANRLLRRLFLPAYVTEREA